MGAMGAMYNELLELNKSMERQAQFESLMRDYSIATKGGYIDLNAWDKLQYLFREQAGLLIDALHILKNGVERETLIKEAVEHLNEQLPRFDHEKGKGIWWSTTVLLCAMRQIIRASEKTNHYKALKERHESKVANSQDKA